MLVIGGKYRSRLLTWPDDAKHIRPTKDRIREAIFNAIGDISNTVTLDLYAGSGAMGIEALSRYAKKSYFVDINKVSLDTIKGNLKSLNIPNTDYEVLPINDLMALSSLHNRDIKFDIVFLDPPYEQGDYARVIKILLEDNMLNENAIIICECNRLLDLPFDVFKKRKDYKYGEITVSILWK